MRTEIKLSVVIYFLLLGKTVDCGPAAAPDRNNIDKSSYGSDYHQIPRVRPNSRAPISFGRATNTANVGPAIPQCADEKKAAFWEKDAQLTLYKKLVHKLNEGTAKNIILFLGDGMSIPTLAAARTYKGQLNGERGEDSELSFEKFPYVGLSKTFCLDKQVADSACSATAYLCGVKANFFTIGVDGRVAYNDCAASNNSAYHVDSIATWAQLAGKSTGLVTTTTVTHASPSAVYAHAANRMWESDFDVKRYNNDPAKCKDIAQQLVYGKTGKNLEVIFGGGRRKFLPANKVDRDGINGERLDGVDLIKNYQFMHENARYIDSIDGLRGLESNPPNRVLGLFASEQMNYFLDRNPQVEPTLPEMTAAAIKMLRRNKNGFFLFIEGGRIDHGHHESKAKKALSETVQFAEAIEQALNLTNAKDTLIVVTSDHSHTMSIAGYPQRGNNILGLNTDISDVDNKPYTTLTYANGFGAVDNMKDGQRVDLSNTTFNKDYRYAGAVPTKYETHGGDDVGIFAHGPWSHLFSGVMNQNAIPHLMAYASCIGPGLTNCN